MVAGAASDGSSSFTGSFSGSALELPDLDRRTSERPWPKGGGGSSGKERRRASSIVNALGKFSPLRASNRSSRGAA